LPYNQEIIYSKLYKLFEGFWEKNTKDSGIKKEKKTLIQVNNYSNLEKECLNKRKACFIALLDGKKNPNSEANFERNIKVLNELVNDPVEKPFTYLYLNATCYEEILLDFNISVDSLPNALVYIPSKEVYTSMIGTFDKESIDSFLSTVIQGRISMQSATKEKFKFNEKDCSSMIEMQIIETDDDDIMKEIMEERRKQEEEEAKQRRESEDKKKNKKKKKKKKSDL
jgi:hypothetical protein